MNWSTRLDDPSRRMAASRQLWGLEGGGARLSDARPARRPGPASRAAIGAAHRKCHPEQDAAKIRIGNSQQEELAPVWRAELSCPGGGVAARGPPVGVLRSAAHRRAESRFWGVFIIAVHRAFVLGLGARHRGIVELSEGVIRCVTVFACYSSSS